MTDSIHIANSPPLPINIIDNSEINWNLLTLIVAVLSLIAAAILPFAQKKYEESKAKFNFRIYVKHQLAYLFNLATYDKIDYIKPANNLEVIKLPVTFRELTKYIRDDFTAFAISQEPILLFQYTLNLQKYCHHIYQIRYCLTQIDTKGLKRDILQHGEKLSQQELKKLHGLLSILDNFSSISLFHDKFENLQSVQRQTSNNIWIGLKVDNILIEKQNQILLSDRTQIRSYENSLHELIGISAALLNQMESYFDKPGK